MNTQDFLNIFLILGFIVIISCIVFITFYLVRALRSFTQLADDLRESTQNLKNKLGFKTLAAIPALMVALFSRIFKRRG